MKALGRAMVALLLLAATVGISFAQETGEGELELTYVLPDFQPYWPTSMLNSVSMTTGNNRDRLVSCDDWTSIDPTPITGQRIISFQLASANLGRGHLRTRRTLTPEGWQTYQTVSQQDQFGRCHAEEFPVAVVPTGGDQSGRWLPLSQFALYSVTKDGGFGDRVSCQVKRWCCLVSSATCSTNPPCSLPPQTDSINAGTRDVYPYHWLDQFILVEGLPTGYYWLENVINPFFQLAETDYSNNFIYFLIYLDQEANRVTVAIPPDPPVCP